MANLDREMLAFAVAGKLRALGVNGPRSAERRFPHISKKTWNEIGHGRALSDINMVAVLAALDLPPSQFIMPSAKHPKNQRKTVSRDVLHETCSAFTPEPSARLRVGRAGLRSSLGYSASASASGKTQEGN